ncbi:hypothetical protein PSECIP111951_02536 [Pseudoalteromonas holothuriae]|uniref:Uncharacterized protein n=1 Tax=Pseudoalteromonas holothuriae TaxID=2963714 RepID=A0A9W4R131_9GAMM|nr:MULTISPECIES: hypothetical protein [unclassified Pseudoalteromonas]CAH9061668.1 hypothetical protein PSECIP111951_02536 [Pseudoalteromonas sp. CIP111951]CAH9061956.1 hypothetical protein PSECIP111854_02916 [Pseudoalteromonas sp. CIP111854]
MNVWILLSGITALITSLIHIFAGQIDPIKPFLNSELPDIPKATLLGCWHIVSLVLVISGVTLTYIGWFNRIELQNVVLGLSITFVAFSLVFLAVGWFFFGYKTFFKLPQWVLLLPIGVLGLIGAI